MAALDLFRRVNDDLKWYTKCSHHSQQSSDGKPDRPNLMRREPSTSPAAFPFNPNKAAEYDPDAALAPPEGASVKPVDPIMGASTVRELNGSDKVGSGGPNIGHNPTVGHLIQPASGDEIEIDISLEAAPAVLYDALVVPDGADAVNALRVDGRTLEFIKDQYRHCKPILAVGAGKQLLDACGIDTMFAQWTGRSRPDGRRGREYGRGQLHRG